MDEEQEARERLIRYLASPLGEFSPWATPGGDSPQLRFIEGAATHKKRVMRAGNRTGKTAIVAWDAAAQLLGLHPFAPTRPPLRCWASGLDWDWGIGDDLWPAFRKVIPQNEIRAVQWQRKTDPEAPRTVTLRNGSVLIFKTAESGRRKYQGREIDLLVINEEHPPDVVEEARRGLVTTGGQLMVALTPVERMRWVQDLEAEEGTLVVRASLRDAAAAGIADDPALLDWLNSIKHPARQAMRDLGDYADLEGSVYPEFSTVTHVARPVHKRLICNGVDIGPWPLPQSMPRYASWDFGYGSGHATAILRAGHDSSQGRLIVERCWYGERIRTSVWARELDEAPQWEGLNCLAGPIVCDHAANDRAEVSQYWDVDLAYKRDRHNLRELVAVLLSKTCRDGAPQLVFVEDPAIEHPRLGRCDAYKVIWEIERYRYAEDREGRPLKADEPLKRDNHAMDALEYLCGWLVKRGAGPQIPLPQRIYAP